MADFLCLVTVQVPRAGKRYQVQQGRDPSGHRLLPQDAEDGPDQEEPPGGGGEGPGSPEQKASQQNTGESKIYLSWRQNSWSMMAFLVSSQMSESLF